MKRILYLLTFAVASTSVVVSSYAAGTRENDALEVPATRITLSQAVTTAEQHVPGKASRAELEKHDGQWVFDVEVVKESKVMDVKVDPASGKVLAAAEDKADSGDEGHEKED
ncbi:peptidase M4 [Desulfopila sp. IMCC35006]|uniref:PepSY domain-containing protein n=1 Tax=Desulfopila sp. IMCC35006 TaxID=2569542 RepID=UPI0010AB67D6|nr:PepSY domain-containing protein [Desulfopila sp. IMCC35006]TKB24279.1 peptidase M4 [Desulfopila sp. IMCC35006]